MSTASSTRLLIIDPQNDFCDLPGLLLPGPQQGGTMAPLPALCTKVVDGVPSSACE